MMTPAAGRLFAAATAMLTAAFCAPGWSEQSRERRTDVSAEQPVSLTPQSTIGEILCHLLLSGFADLLLPWDGRSHDERLPLERIASLLPYHSHVDPETVVRGLNRMLDDLSGGKTVFYRFYSPEEIEREPAKQRTGLFYFRGKPGAPFAVICPGGGFAYVASVHEGFPHAAEISGTGLNAFVLRYRTGSGGRPATEDLAAALAWIIRHADSLGVAREGYSLWGSSAGARMAAAIGSHGAAAFGGAGVPRPVAVIMAYTGHLETSAQEPPTFAVAGETDSIAPPSIMKRRVEALRRLGTPVELRVFPNVGHGFGLGTGTSAAGWIQDAIRFWDAARKAGRRKP